MEIIGEFFLNQIKDENQFILKNGSSNNHPTVTKYLLTKYCS